jgi:luciferase family oxidoreductase group 1
LSVLDLVPVSEETGPAAALAASVELAKQAEAMGHRRYWVAEHHNMPGIASSAPAVLIGRLAAATQTMHIGSGGVMLPNHPPLVVAEQFGMLTAMFPGRVDLGIGRAPGTDPVTARALRRSAGPLSVEDFPAQLDELCGYFDGHTEGMVNAVPAPGNRPEIWLLGSSGYSARLAAQLGWPFAFAHHINPLDAVAAIALYREEFRSSSMMVCTTAVCAQDAEHARYLAGPLALSRLNLRRGKPRPLASPKTAAGLEHNPIEQNIIDEALAAITLGDQATVATRLSELVERTGANELMVTSMLADPEDRLTSHQLVAEALAAR